MATTIRLGSAAPQDNRIIDTENNIPIKVLTFSGEAEDFGKAAVLFREAVGNIDPLSDSLLGRRPDCMRDRPDFNYRHHQDMRKFSDLEGFKAFKEYLHGLFVGCYPTTSICGDSGNEGEGLIYSTTSGRATIQFHQEGEVWRIHGHARFYNPVIVARQLRKKGFKVEVAG